ncbi:MAG: hypothetical protein LBV74_05550 [Tannerella sp.]|nr:hypothetical protein [Tannerella sp.]
MEYFLLLIPFVTCGVLFIFYRQKVHILEYVITIFLSVGLFFGIKAWVKYTGSRSIEYLGYYVTSVNHYEQWNEYIERTCTREVPDGTDAGGNTIYRTETYDCSYVQDHPEYYTYALNNKEQIDISWSTYQYHVDLWGGKTYKIDMNRNYHTIDGDVRCADWNGDVYTCRCLTLTQGYTNPIKGSSSTYKADKVSKKEAGELELYEYPPVLEKEQSAILSKQTVSDKDIRKWKFLNAFYGYSHQIRVYLLFYYDKDVSVSNKQTAYWNGGNMNEMLIHVGVSSDSLHVQWANVTSWSDVPLLEINIRDEIMTYKDSPLDLHQLSDFISTNLGLWKRKNFSDFKYLRYEYSMREFIFMTLLMVIISAILARKVIRNKYHLHGVNKDDHHSTAC